MDVWIQCTGISIRLNLIVVDGNDGEVELLLFIPFIMFELFCKRSRWQTQVENPECH